MPTTTPARPRGATAVGLLGEVLVTAGVLVALFAVWQLWWTDVVAERAQARIVADLAWADSSPDAPPDASAPPGPPPTLDEPAHATTFATLSVPRWDADLARPVSQGVSRDVLDERGIGHYPGTAMPGAVGNFALAGHRVTYGRPFAAVEELRPGDELVVGTEVATYVYRVTATVVVPPSGTQVLAPVPGDPGARPTVASITLTTCHPMYSARERFVVHGTLDRWSPAGPDAPGGEGA